MKITLNDLPITNYFTQIECIIIIILLFVVESMLPVSTPRTDSYAR